MTLFEQYLSYINESDEVKAKRLALAKEQGTLKNRLPNMKDEAKETARKRLQEIQKDLDDLREKHGSNIKKEKLPEGDAHRPIRVQKQEKAKVLKKGSGFGVPQKITNVDVDPKALRKKAHITKDKKLKDREDEYKKLHEREDEE